MGTLNERSAKAQIIWNSTLSNSIDPVMVGSLFYDINIQKLERDNSNAVYQTYDASYTKVAAINPTTKKMTLIDIPSVDLSNLGYTPENVSNKSDSYIASSSTTYASTKALVDGLSTKLDKGTYTGTAQDLKNDIDGIQIGGRNLALNSKTFIDQNSDWLRNFILSENLIIGQKYTIRAKFRSIQNANDVFHINDVNGGNSYALQKISPSEFGLTFTANADSIELVLIRYPMGSWLWYQFESFKIEKGNKATDWTPAPEDLLYKPTTTSNTTSYPFVVGEDGNGNSARLPAGDLGKNFFNSDLSSTTARNHTMNAGVTINTLGNPYSITGLPDKASDTTNFDNVVRYNPTTGQFAYGNAFVYNVPSTITVNHVNTPASPDVPSYIQAIQDRLTQLHQSGVVMQRFTDWNIITLNNLQDTNTNVKNNETINTYLQPFFNDSSISVGSDIISIHSSKVLPRNSDFAIRFSVKLGHDAVPAFGQIGNVTNRLIGLFTGTVGAFCSPELYVYDANGDYGTNLLSLQSTGATVKTISARAATDTSTVIYTGNQAAVINFIILKVGDNILVQANYGTKTLSEIYPASVIGSGDFGFCVKVQKPQASNSSTGVVSNIRYYIFP